MIDLMESIKEFGGGLNGIILLMNDYYGYPAIGSIISPELKTLTLGSHSLDYEHYGLLFLNESLEDLFKRCKKLKDLKIIKAYLHPNEGEIKKIFPNCNVELKECKFACGSCGEFDDCDCVIDSENSNDDGEQDSSFENAHDADEINDVLDNSDGVEIEEEENGN